MLSVLGGAIRTMSSSGTLLPRATTGALKAIFEAHLALAQNRF